MKKYKVLDHPWHLAHSYDLLKNPNIEWSYLLNTYRKWEWTIRGKKLEELASWVPYYEKGKYDLALMHLDQSCINPRLGKSKLFHEVNGTVQDIPKILIQHGTPMLDGYSEDMVLNGGEIKRDKSEQYEYWKGIKELSAGMPVVVNSYKAKERWGFGEVIWHGMDPDEWWYDLPKEPRVVSYVAPAGMSDEYYGRPFLQTVRSILKEEYGIHHQWITLEYTPEFDVKRYHKNAFDAYRNFLGRSLIFLDPTTDSPMPRSRTEAMMSGCCLITTSNHDVDKYIESGVNGFIVPRDAAATAKLIADLIYLHPKEAAEIGQRGRQTAVEKFHIDRFNQDWVNLIEKTIKEYHGKS